VKFILTMLCSALIIATVAQVGRRYPQIAALLISLPLTSLIALSFLYAETKDVEKVSSLSYSIFWLVLPSLLFFLLLPALLKTGWNFWFCLMLSSLALIGFYTIYAFCLGKVGIRL
jgi:hypothetical protein